MAHLVDVRTIALNIRDIFRVLAGFRSARKILRQIKPNIVFSKGGFVAVPVGLAARLQKIPIVTHDSDTVPGLANRIIGRFAQVHATGMPAKYHSYPEETVHYVGIPLDERIKPVTAQMQKDLKKQLGLPKDALTLLFSGGGLGAQDINKKAVVAAPELLTRFKNLHIIHITGQKHEPEVKEKYQDSAPDDMDRVKVIGFTPDFSIYTGAADLVITRAGATTIAELAAQRKAVILIPAPHLTGGQQLKNAKELERHKAVLVIANEADDTTLLKAITKVLEDDAKRRQLSDKLGSLAKVDAANKLAEILLDVAKQHRNKSTNVGQ